MTTTNRINAINLRINLLRSRRSECSAIIKKLIRKKRVLQTQD